MSIPLARLITHGIASPHAPDPAAVVRWSGAIQAQDFHAALWAVGLRLRAPSTAAALADAFDKGLFLRTHVLRPTWHLVPPRDILWMLQLTAGRVRRALAPYDRKHGVDSNLCARAATLFEHALRDRTFLTRAELAERLRHHGIDLNGLQLAQVAMHAELDGLICSGPRRGKQFTYALLAERAPAAAPLPRDEALATLARRFLRSHGPATLRDFVWWSGLPAADARRALEATSARPHPTGNATGSATVNVSESQLYWTVETDPTPGPPLHQLVLLPAYDEYAVAYRDRHPDPNAVAGTPSVVTAAGTVGAWRATPRAGGLHLQIQLPQDLLETHRQDLAQAVNRYAAFRTVPCEYELSRKQP